jgi:ribosomal protein L37AE/L43A
MGVKIKFNKNWDKFKKDPLALAQQFPCPVCKTASKRVAEKEFFCPNCNQNFKIEPKYVNGQ